MAVLTVILIGARIESGTLEGIRRAYPAKRGAY